MVLFSWSKSGSRAVFTEHVGIALGGIVTGRGRQDFDLVGAAAFRFDPFQSRGPVTDRVAEEASVLVEDGVGARQVGALRLIAADKIAADVGGLAKAGDNF